MIAPGINLSLQALHMAAAKLPCVAIARTEKVIGTNTVACMQSGIFWGYVGLVEGLVARIKAEFGAPMRVIATGGLAPLFDGATPAIERDRPRPDALGPATRLRAQQDTMTESAPAPASAPDIRPDELAFLALGRRRRDRHEPVALRLSPGNG